MGWPRIRVLATLAVVAARTAVLAIHLPAELNANALDGAQQAERQGGGRRIAVCIVGQLSRLETASKLTNLLRPLSESRPVDLFVVLEQGSHFFVNSRTVVDSPGCLSEPTPEQVQEKLRPFYKAGEFPTHRNYTANMQVWENYGTEKHSINRTTRLSAHLSQWEHLHSCAKLVESHEKASGFSYETVIKLRDNTIVVEPFSLNDHARLFVQVKGCKGWVGGISDKVLITPRQYLFAAFSGAFTIGQRAEEGEADAQAMVRKLVNPEMMAKTALNTYGAAWEKVSAKALPLVDGRCSHVNDEGGKEWCLVTSHKDCYPPTHGRFDTCAQKLPVSS